MRSVKYLFLCSIIALISMKEPEAASVLLPELSSTSLRRVVHKAVLPTQWSLQHRFYSSSSICRPQLYGVATYDALFKYVLSDDKIRSSFFRAFIADLSIVSSERLDDHINPLQNLQLLRAFLHSKNTKKDVVESLTPVPIFEASRKDSVTQKLGRDDKATAFLHEMVSRSDEIKWSFSRLKFDGTVDFVCHLANNEYALVDIQVIPGNYWDRRALAYVAAFYGNQLLKVGEKKHIIKVIGINILGRDTESKEYWVDTQTQFMCHYKSPEQPHAFTKHVYGIELMHYSIMNAPKTLDDQERSDWIAFLKNGRFMNEEQVQQRIKTPAVLDAFKLAKINSLPAEVLETYEAEDQEYGRYSQHTEYLIQQGKLKGKVKALVELIKTGKITIEDIMQNDNYSDEIKSLLKNSSDLSG